MQTTKALLVTPVLVSCGSGLLYYCAVCGKGAILFNEWIKELVPRDSEGSLGRLWDVVGL